MNGQFNKVVEKLRDKAYRDAYVESHVKIGIPYQIRALREQEGRKWTQGQLGKRCSKPANVISRLEDPEYGAHTIKTLLELASAFDVALLVKFVSYSRFLKEFERVSPQALEVPSFTSDVALFPSNRPSLLAMAASNVTNIPQLIITTTTDYQAINTTQAQVQIIYDSAPILNREAHTTTQYLENFPQI